MQNEQPNEQAQDEQMQPNILAPGPSLPFDAAANVPADLEEAGVSAPDMGEAAVPPDPEAVEAAVPADPPPQHEAGEAAVPADPPPQHEAGEAAVPADPPPQHEAGEAAVPADPPPQHEAGEAAVPADPPPQHEAGEAAVPDAPQLEEADIMGADDAPVPAEPAAAAAPRHVAPRENFSPDVLSELAPPQCYIGSDAKAHRWKMKFRVKDDAWAARTESFSRAFINRPWLDALQEVHKEAWDRWRLVQHKPEFFCDSPQEPGVIPEDLMPRLQEHVDGLPAAVNYSSKAK